MEEDYGSGTREDPVILWPQVHQQISWLIPEALRRQHAETQKCFTAKAYTATVVMVRRTLEGVCIDHGVADRSLVGMLRELRDQGKIEGRILEWAQALRVLGNEGAHYSEKPVTKEDAADALALAEALLDYLYVYAAQFEKFKARRATS